MPRKKNDITADSTSQQFFSLLNRHIEEKGLRHTQEREWILAAVLQLSSRFTIDELAEEVRKSHGNVCRGTVVNAVALMVESGLLLRVGSRGRTALYQRSPKPSRRDVTHRVPFGISLQCITCGAVKDVRDSQATAALASRRFSAFRPVSGVVTVFGMCGKCSAKK